MSSSSTRSTSSPDHTNPHHAYKKYNKKRQPMFAAIYRNFSATENRSERTYSACCPSGYYLPASQKKCGYLPLAFLGHLPVVADPGKCSSSHKGTWMWTSSKVTSSKSDILTGSWQGRAYKIPCATQNFSQSAPRSASIYDDGCHCDLLVFPRYHWPSPTIRCSERFQRPIPCIEARHMKSLSLAKFHSQVCVSTLE